MTPKLRWVTKEYRTKSHPPLYTSMTYKTELTIQYFDEEKKEWIDIPRETVIIEE